MSLQTAALCILVKHCKTLTVRVDQYIYLRLTAVITYQKPLQFKFSIKLNSNEDAKNAL